jgi:hypothetical protein
MRSVFCPLKKEWFALVAVGRKTWEFRSTASPVGRAILSRTPPFPIRFREGYRGESVTAVAEEVKVFSSPEEIPEDILWHGCATAEKLRGLGMTGKVVAIRFTLTRGDYGRWLK